MGDAAGVWSQPLERYRAYLMLLARVQMGPRLARLLDPADLVQQTLMEAHQHRAQFRGGGGGKEAAWLRRILARNLTDAVRGAGRAKRDAARLRSLDSVMTGLGRSSRRLSNWMVSQQPSPLEHVQRNEWALQLADALTQLSGAQQDALVLHYWHRTSLEQIADQTGRTPMAVAGLLKRGLKSLRQILTEQNGRGSP